MYDGSLELNYREADIDKMSSTDLYELYDFILHSRCSIQYKHEMERKIRMQLIKHAERAKNAR